ncbi:helix-turn-helix transcriptional regulator [Cellulomonas endophytica]|uniref:helix-turn-helix transcriptional regulator n=1 Tax=Cellulomonas endophytica TaxID=2494735 RepID=UPI0010130020|nr:helix-turn-helix transcriptional regulator [Cellulomonas endophytica]
MHRLQARVRTWAELTEDLLLSPAAGGDTDRIAALLTSGFGAESVSLNRREPDGRHALTLWTVDRDRLPVLDAVQLAVATHPDLLDHHPLLRWFGMTGTVQPQSLGRVPLDRVAGPGTPAVLEVLETLDIRQQLALPVMVAGREHEAFVLARPGTRDFADDDLLLASLVQGFLRVLRLQARVLAPHAAAPDAATVTERERAVLLLAAEGRTAAGIAHALGMAPRTAEKHLERAYRKLGVRDRVSAVRVGQESGVLPAPRAALGIPTPRQGHRAVRLVGA